DLDRRGHGDIRTLTVREYQACTRIERFKYRLYRNPILLFGFGPLYLMVSSRKNPSGVSAKGDGTVSAQSTNLAILLLIAAMSWLIGLKAVVLIYLPVFLVAGAAGIWLFYVQHQFEDTYWEPHDDWDYAASAMRGSSYYKLPKVLEWMTGNIGLHHVHHFDPKVPSYNLGRCYVENDEFRCATVLGIRESLHTASLKLWDEDARRMVGYEAVK
ncbi:MAG: fatty acid desaturase, partial [Gemmatimonadaceae bacterium]